MNLQNMQLVDDPALLLLWVNMDKHSHSHQILVGIHGIGKGSEKNPRLFQSVEFISDRFSMFKIVYVPGMMRDA